MRTLLAAMIFLAPAAIAQTQIQEEKNPDGSRKSLTIIGDPAAARAYELDQARHKQLRAAESARTQQERRNRELAEAAEAARRDQAADVAIECGRARALQDDAITFKERDRAAAKVSKWCPRAAAQAAAARGSSTTYTTSGRAPSASQGAINPVTGQYYPPVAGGVINPQTGTFYPSVAGGYVNSKTGEFMPAIK